MATGFFGKLRRAPRAIAARWPLWVWKARFKLYQASMLLHARQMPRAPEITVPTAIYGDGGGGYCLATEGLGPDSVVYSVGIGCEVSFDKALIAAHGLHVHGFDPTAEAARYVASQAMPPNFHFHPYGLSAADGELEIQAIRKPTDNYRAATVLDIGKGEGDTIRVPMRSLTTIMRELGHDHVDVLKLDIEGGEYPVLEGLLAGDMPIRQIVLEFHPHLINMQRHGRMIGRVGWDETAQAIARLREHGYRIFYVSPRGTEFSFLR